MYITVHFFKCCRLFIHHIPLHDMSFYADTIYTLIIMPTREIECSL